jgi:hypothetical protein
MRGITLSAAALALAAMFASAPANAEYMYGPVKNGNQCWIGAQSAWGTFGGGTFGYWGPCAQPAAVAAAPRHHRHAHS